MYQSLVNKYNVADPHYTSYPTVLYCNIDTFSLLKWMASLKQFFEESNDSVGLSLYLSFCESLYTFCGCHKRITKRKTCNKKYVHGIRSVITA